MRGAVAAGPDAGTAEAGALEPDPPASAAGALVSSVAGDGAGRASCALTTEQNHRLANPTMGITRMMLRTCRQTRSDDF